MADQFATLVSDSSEFGNKPEKKIKKKKTFLSAFPAQILLK